MNNPLDEDIATFEILEMAFDLFLDAFKNNQKAFNGTPYFGMTAQEFEIKLKAERSNLEELISMGMFATFERTLKDYIVDHALNQLAACPTNPPELAQALHEWLKNGAKNWNMETLPKLFKPSVSDHDIAQVGDIRAFRKHVAHGAPPPVSKPPQMVYSNLTKFLQSAGVIHS